MARTVRRLLTFIEPGHRAAWVGLVVFALLVTGLEIAAAFLIFVVTQLVADDSAPIRLPILQDPRGWLPGRTDQDVLIIAMVVIAGFFLIRAGIVLLQSYIRARIAERTGVRLSSRLFRGYLEMPYPVYLQRNSAELIRNVNEAVKDVVDFTLIPALRIASEVLVIAGLSLVLVLVSPLAAALAAALFIPLIAVLFRVVQPRSAALGRTSHEMGRRALVALQQSLHGFRDITLLGRRDHFAEQHETIRVEMARTRYLRQLFGEVPRVALETGLMIFVALYLGGAAVLGNSTQESLAVLGMFAYAALRILPSITRVVQLLNDLEYGAAAADDVQRDLEAIRAAPQGLAVGKLEGGDGEAVTLASAIQLVGVGYRYPTAERDALIDVNLEIERGESIGIVGQTGGGKSTLLDVILGLLPPTTGRVLVDGTDIHTALQTWQEKLGVVPQPVYLFDTTLRGNIALGFDDAAVDAERLDEAVRLAQLEGFVASLPQGLDTVVGERGLRISGGQRQRVAIARALYPRPQVLLLDEGTSALDTITEAELMRALEPLRHDRTLIIVAHRLATVRDCDRILLVDAGRVVDSGSFAELMDRNPLVRHLASTPPPD